MVSPIPEKPHFFPPLTIEMTRTPRQALLERENQKLKKEMKKLNQKNQILNERINFLQDRLAHCHEIIMQKTICYLHSPLSSPMCFWISPPPEEEKQRPLSPETRRTLLESLQGHLANCHRILIKKRANDPDPSGTLTPLFHWSSPVVLTGSFELVSKLPEEEKQRSLSPKTPEATPLYSPLPSPASTVFSSHHPPADLSKRSQSALNLLNKKEKDSAQRKISTFHLSAPPHMPNPSQLTSSRIHNGRSAFKPVSQLPKTSNSFPPQKVPEAVNSPRSFTPDGWHQDFFE